MRLAAQITEAARAAQSSSQCQYGSIGADTLTNISQAIAGGYSVNLRSPGGNNGDPFISSALSF